jgi:guanylate kinase
VRIAPFAKTLGGFKQVNERFIQTFEGKAGIEKTLSRMAATCPVVHKPRAMIVAGPSGVGKGTLLTRLREEYPSVFGYSVSHTTRDPRPGETNGVHYHFVNHEQMNKNIEDGLMLEHANVHGNFYGTSCAAVEKVGAENKICILEIDVQGCRQCRKANLEGVYIFVSPPSMDELEKRLRGRNTETEDKIVKRLANAKAEMDAREEPGLFDFKVCGCVSCVFPMAMCATRAESNT